MRKLTALSLALALGLSAPAFAQVNVVPQTGVTSGYVPKATYSAGFVGLVPAASATDTVCIKGSATKTVKVQKILLNGTAGTLVTVPVSLVKKATADTGGTAASTTANPANTITKLDSAFATASAVPISYTAVPTINDAGTIMAAGSVTLNVTGTTAAPNNPLVFDFTGNNTNLLSPLVLRGVAQQACLHLNTISVSSGVLNGYIVWTEE